MFFIKSVGKEYQVVNRRRKIMAVVKNIHNIQIVGRNIKHGEKYKGTEISGEENQD